MLALAALRRPKKRTPALHPFWRPLFRAEQAFGAVVPRPHEKPPVAIFIHLSAQNEPRRCPCLCFSDAIVRRDTAELFTAERFQRYNGCWRN